MFPGLDYKLIPSTRGNKLLMLHGFTYAMSGKNCYCSMRIQTGCRARLKLDNNGKIVKALYTEHIHERPKYIITPTGQYVKV